MAKRTAKVTSHAPNTTFEELGPMGLPEVEGPAAALLEVRSRIYETRKEEKEKNEVLVKAMEAAHKDYYKRDGLEVIIPPGKTPRATVKHKEASESE